MISMVGWIFICAIIYIIKNCIIQPIEDKRLYKMYEARDELALSAAQKKINQNDKNYEYTMDKINFLLYYTKNDYDFNILFNNLIREVITNPEEIDVADDYIFKNEHTKNAFCKVYTHFQNSIKYRLVLFSVSFFGIMNIIIWSMLLFFGLVQSFFNVGYKVMNFLQKGREISTSVFEDTISYCKLK